MVLSGFRWGEGSLEDCLTRGRTQPEPGCSRARNKCSKNESQKPQRVHAQEHMAEVREPQANGGT